jgi:hypothetical protein
MARMRLDGVGSPVDQEVGPILHFAERAGHLADQLRGDLARAVRERRVAVDHAPNCFRQLDGGSL